MGLRTLKPSDGFSDLAPGVELLPMIGGKMDRRSVSRDASASPGQARPAGSNTKATISNSGPEGTIFYDVHIFYYTWYGNPHLDGKYIHWDHILVPHWDPKIASSYPRGRHMPPEDIGSSFYPELNPYSSRDPDVLESHMEQIGASAAGTVQRCIKGQREFLREGWKQNQKNKQTNKKQLSVVFNAQQLHRSLARVVAKLRGFCLKGH